MADLGIFARRIRQRARTIDRRVSVTVVRTAQAIDQAVVVATPVDTGRARANWIASIGSPARDVLDDTDQGGQATISQNDATIKTHKPEQTIFISNNLDYIQALNEGSSAQAPENFVELAVKTGINFLRRQRVVR